MITSGKKKRYVMLLNNMQKMARKLVYSNVIQKDGTTVCVIVDIHTCR